MKKLLFYAGPALGIALISPPALAQSPDPTGSGANVAEIDAARTDDTAAISYLREAFDLTAEEAAARIDREASVEGMLEVSSALAGKAWAGASIDHADGGTVRLHVTSDEAAKLIASQQLPKWAIVEIVPRSPDDLRRLREDFGEFVRSSLTTELELMPHDEAVVAFAELDRQGWRANLDIASNAVVVSVAAGSEEVLGLARDFTRMHSGDSSLPPLVVNSVEGLDLTPSNDGCPTQTGGCIPLRGGVDLQRSELNVVCTTGFTFTRAGARFTSSADHCNPGQPWKRADQLIGDTAWQRTSPSVDAMMVRVNDNGLWKTANTVWRPGNPDFRITSQISSPDNSLQGITICHVGFGLRVNGFNAESCGPLTSIDGQFAPNWKNPSWDGLGVASYRQCSGDSGGPVFNGATGRAYGLIRGRTNAGGANCSIGGQNGAEAMFSWVSQVEAASGFDVVLAP